MAEHSGEVDRADICRRHGLAPQIASQLAGGTRAELEADAAARAAIAQMFGASTVEPVEADAPRPVEAFSDDELDAQHRAIADEQVRRREQEETDQFLQALFRPKPGHVAAIREIHGCDEEEGP